MVIDSIIHDGVEVRKSGTDIYRQHYLQTIAVAAEIMVVRYKFILVGWYQFSRSTHGLIL